MIPLAAIRRTMVGAVGGYLALSIATVFLHARYAALPALVQAVVVLGASCVGGALGYLRWGKSRGMPATTHGSAKFGDERRARKALATPAA